MNFLFFAARANASYWRRLFASSRYWVKMAADSSGEGDSNEMVRLLVFRSRETLLASSAARIASQSPGGPGSLLPEERKASIPGFTFPVAGSYASPRIVFQWSWRVKTRTVRSLLLNW